MRKTERYICIFCVIFGFAAMYVIGYRYGNDGSGEDIVLKEDINKEKPYISTDSYDNEYETKDVITNDIIISDNTTLILETCREENMSDIDITEMKMPVELIGYDRQKVIEFLEEKGDFFSDDEEEIINIMLVSFAEDKIVIRKNVKQGAVIIYPNGESEQYNYYISFKEEKVVVYKKDKETIFIETGITYDMIDWETRTSIEEGVWIENINTLYRYLESITS